MQQRSLPGLDLLQVVERKSRQTDQPGHEEEEGHRAEGRRRAAQVSSPVAGRGAEHEAEEVGGDGLDQPASREPAGQDDASHAILPV